MYKLLLIFRYLRRKLAPMFAALAVMLCTAMVIIVISVMGGFLDMLRTSAHKLSGDVIVTGGSYTGFPYYQDLLDRLAKDPAVAAATPIIHSYGLIHLEGQTIPVQVEGIRPKQMNKVVPYYTTLRWSKQDYLDRVEAEFPPLNERTAEDRKQLAAKKQRINKFDPIKKLAMDLNRPDDIAALLTDEATSRPSNRTALPSKAPAVLGIAVSPYATRDPHGHYHFSNSAVSRPFILTVVPISRSGVPSQTSLHQMFVVNEFKSGLYEIDSNRIYVGFNLLQKMLFMAPSFKVDPMTGEPTNQKVPGRASEVMIKGTPGYTEAQVQHAAQNAANAVMKAHPAMPGLLAETWQQKYHTILNAVENEKGLVTFLFVIISIVAVVMVATTFYMTVLEKTRDIGVLRAIGASRLGIMTMFLGYGLAIGVVGAAIGLGVAWAIVTHLNQIQNIIADWTGWRMWNPQVYAFDHIPDQVQWFAAWIIAAGAVVSSVVGSLIPAILAAALNPVEALRHE